MYTKHVVLSYCTPLLFSVANTNILNLFILVVLKSPDYFEDIIIKKQHIMKNFVKEKC